MEETKKLASLLHTLICNKPHASEMSDLDNIDLCCYYIEESIDEAWNLKDHLFWYKEAQRFISIAEPHGIQNVVQHMVRVCQTVRGFEATDPRLGEFMMRMLDKNLFKKGE